MKRLASILFILMLPSVLYAQPNVILIVADDLGFSDLGCYGGEIATPNLDSLAEHGQRLTRFYTTGRCCPSRASILTGQYPHRVGVGHKVLDLGRPGYRGRISDDAVTIAEVLRDQKYRSFVSGKWHLGTPDPTENGFEEFYGTLVSGQTFWDPDHFLRMPKGRKSRQYIDGQFYGTDAVTDHAIDFLDLARQTPDQPWFLYLAYQAPHFPIQARDADIAKYADTYAVGWDAIRNQRLAKMKKLGIVSPDTPLTPRSPYWNYGETVTGVNPAWDTLAADRRIDLARRMAIYAAMIDRIDQNIGRLISDLRNAGEFERTLMIFISDNGACAEWDPFGFDIQSSNQNILYRGQDLEKMGGPGTFHSVGSGWANAANTPWRLQKHYTHEGGISSPCIVHWPDGNIRAGVIEHQPAHIIDLMPTIVEATGCTYSGKLRMAGHSLLPLLGDGTLSARPLFFEHEGNRAIHDGDWKLVALRDEPWELYNVGFDRTELNDLAKQHPEKVAELARKWERWGEESFVTPMPQDYGVKYLRPPRKSPPSRR
jgi:arylsulfatase